MIGTGRRRGIGGNHHHLGGTCGMKGGGIRATGIEIGVVETGGGRGVVVGTGRGRGPR